MHESHEWLGLNLPLLKPVCLVNTKVLGQAEAQSQLLTHQHSIALTVVGLDVPILHAGPVDLHVHGQGLLVVGAVVDDDGVGPSSGTSKV